MWEPTRREIEISWQKRANVELARAIHQAINGSYDGYDAYEAHRWALKLIKHKPQSGLDVMLCMINYGWMADSAKQEYANAPATRQRYDAACSAYLIWFAKQQAIS